MSEWKGMIVACDRCGKEYRRKFLGEKELDGGFTHIGKFEKMAETWEYRHDIGWLCPECNSEYKSLLMRFMKGSDNGKDIQSTDER